MKSPLVLFVVSCLTLCYVVFRVLTKPRAEPASDIALVHYAIQNSCSFCTKRPEFGIDTVFRTKGLTAKRAAGWKETINKALMRNTFAAILAGVDAACLMTPNTSPELKALRLRPAKTHDPTSLRYLLTYSAACPLPDGSTCFYVESLEQDLGRQMGTGDIYVVRKGAVVSVLSVWTN